MGADCLCSAVCLSRRLLAGIQLMDDAQLPAELPSLIEAQVAAAEERAGSPHADVINSFFELQAGRKTATSTLAGLHVHDDCSMHICSCVGVTSPLTCMPALQSCSGCLSSMRSLE